MTPLFREMERVSQRFTTAIRGLTVVKTVWANDEGLSVVRFEISSDRDDPARFRLVESVPAEFPMENIGPHPKYGGDKWTKTGDGEFVYTDRLEPDGEKSTLYGIKGLSESTLESFLTDAVVTIDPVGDEPATDSDDATIMTTDDTENGEPDDDTEQDDDFTRGEGSEDFTRGGSGDFTRGAGGNFDDRIPRVEDLNSVSGGWGGEQPHQRNGPSDIQFVGSKAHTSESSETDDSSQPIELEDPTRGDGETDDSDTEADDSEAGRGDAAESDAIEPSGPGTDHESDGDSNTDVGDDDVGSGEDTADEDDAVEDDSTEDVDTGHETASEDDSLFDDELETDDDESIVDALVTELSERDLSDDERAVLREALGPSERTSVDVRLRHVQNRVDDLSAYIEALESFLDENGTAEQVLDDLQSESEAMRDDIDDLEAAVTASQEALTVVERQVQALEDRMVDEATFEERLDELDGKLVSESELEGELDELTDELAALRDDVETGKQWRSNLSQAIQLPGMMESDGGEIESDEE
ncbi:hypothetical protein [Haloferax sp. YSMS24]|uniref:hypothetical protein n=1 Tax=Haloferax sp. YSMS24 TaxID=3388425 RepID=UPI00398D2D94